MANHSLPANLDTRAAPELFEALRGFQGESLTIDGSQVETLGGQCLQILLSACSEWQGSSAVLEIENASEAFQAQWIAFGAPAEFLGPQGVTQ